MAIALSCKETIEERLRKYSSKKDSRRTASMIKTEKYSISGKVLPFHEMIGLNVRVSVSKDTQKQALQGKIVDETQRTFTIEMQNGMEKIIPKNESTFAFDLTQGEVIEVEGKNILYTPVERLKAAWGN